MENRGAPIAVVCVNTAQFNEFIDQVSFPDRGLFVRACKLSDVRGKTFSRYIQLHGTRAVPYQRIIAVLNGERLTPLPKIGTKQRGWKGLRSRRAD